MLAIFGFLAIAVAYTMRVVLSVAITEMVVKPNLTENNAAGHSICPADDADNNNNGNSVIFIQKSLFIIDFC